MFKSFRKPAITMDMGMDTMYGIHELYRPPAGQEPEIDIVAVHGLGGGVRKTWTARENKVCWLEDLEFLPKFIKNARILTWGYNASYSSILGANPSQNRTHDHAHTLVANLAADRRLNGTSTNPIIFLCHSLGGIIVKRVRTEPSLLPPFESLIFLRPSPTPRPRSMSPAPTYYSPTSLSRVSSGLEGFEKMGRSYTFLSIGEKGEEKEVDVEKWSGERKGDGCKLVH